MVIGKYMSMRNKLTLVVEMGQYLYLFEIKSAMTITSKHASSLLRIAGELKSMVKTSSIISRSSHNYSLKNKIINYNWKNLLLG